MPRKITSKHPRQPARCAFHLAHPLYLTRAWRCCRARLFFLSLGGQLDVSGCFRSLQNRVWNATSRIHLHRNTFGLAVKCCDRTLLNFFSSPRKPVGGMVNEQAFLSPATALHHLSVGMHRDFYRPSWMSSFCHCFFRPMYFRALLGGDIF